MLRTERLVLRPLEDGDAPAIHEAYSDPETMQWWHLPLSDSLEESARRVRELRGNAAQFAICIGEGSTPAVGHVGWLTAPRGGRGGFGYLLRRDQWGRGIAHEAAAAAMQHGFESLGVGSAELWVYEANRRSARLAERLGCTLRGKFVAFNVARGQAFDTLVFGLTARELGIPDAPADPARIVRVIPSISVRDLQTTVTFWTQQLGFGIEFSVGDPPTMASLVRGDWAPQNAVVRFRQSAEPPARPPLDGTLDVLAPDIDGLNAELLTRGTPIAEPLETKPYGIRELVVVDPDGVRVRFYVPALV